MSSLEEPGRPGASLAGNGMNGSHGDSYDDSVGDSYPDPSIDDGSLDATARVVDTGSTDEERRIEAALRPRRLADFPGQQRVRDQLGLVLEAARRRQAPPDHVLLSG